MNLIGLLVTLLVLVFVGAIAFWIIQKTLPDPFKTPALAIVGLIAIIFLLSLLFGGVPVPGLRF